MMKQIFIFIAVLTICGSLCQALDEKFIQKIMKQMQEIGEACVKETGASDDDVGELLERKIPNTKEGKCMISCFGIHLGITDADGNYNEEGAKTAFSPLKEASEDLYNKIVQISNECSKEAVISNDKCETAASYLQCTLKKEKENGLENGPLSY